MHILVPGNAELFYAVTMELDALGHDVRLWVIEQPVDMTPDEVRVLADRAVANQSRGIRAAFVVPDGNSFGLTRMYEVFRERADVRTRTFTERQDAIDWLLGGSH